METDDKIFFIYRKNLLFSFAEVSPFEYENKGGIFLTNELLPHNAELNY